VLPAESSQQWRIALWIFQVLLSAIFKEQLYNCLITFFYGSRQWSLTLVLNREFHLRPQRGTYSLYSQRTVLAINIYSIDLFRYGWIHLHTAIVKENSVSRQSSIDLFRNGWVHLHTAIVKEESVNGQSSINLFRHGCIHLPTSKGGQCQRQSS
jgi:hypothetical protein